MYLEFGFVHLSAMPAELRREQNNLVTVSSLLMWMLELSWSPLQKQYVLLTVEPLLQPFKDQFWITKPISICYIQLT